MSYSTIMRSNLAGSDFSVIATAPDVTFSHGVTIDYEHDWLYYVDFIQEVMTRMDLDGNNEFRSCFKRLRLNS